MRASVLCWLSIGLLCACKSTDAGVAPQGARPAADEVGKAAPSSPRSSPGAAPKAATHRPGGASASSVQPTPSAGQPKQAYRIAAVGDSLTDKRSFGGGYLDYVQKRCPETRIDNFAKGGHMLNQIRQRFDSSVHNQPHGTYTHVVVWGGVNDLYSDLTAGRTPDKAQADLLVIYEKARNKGAKVVAITVSPWAGFRRFHNERRQRYTVRLNRWIRAQLQQGTIDYLLDAYQLLSCGDQTRLCPEYEQSSRDGLHLGAPGHELLGKALFEAVFADCR